MEITRISPKYKSAEVEYSVPSLESLSTAIVEQVNTNTNRKYNKVLPQQAKRNKIISPLKVGTADMEMGHSKTDNNNSDTPTRSSQRGTKQTEQTSIHLTQVRTEPYSDRVFQKWGTPKIDLFATPLQNASTLHPDIHTLSPQGMRCR